MPNINIWNDALISSINCHMSLKPWRFKTHYVNLFVIISYCFNHTLILSLTHMEFTYLLNLSLRSLSLSFLLSFSFSFSPVSILFASFLIVTLLVSCFSHFLICNGILHFILILLIWNFCFTSTGIFSPLILQLYITHSSKIVAYKLFTAMS